MFMAKKDGYQNRFYRQWVKTGKLVKTRIVIEETDLLILSKDRVDSEFAKEKIKNLRQDIKDYIVKDKRSALSLKPIPVELTAAPVIRMMAEAAYLANVGPMAAVAGSIAQLLAEELLKKGHREIIIENGGDIFLTEQEKDRLIAVFAGDSKFSDRLNLLIKTSQTPCGVCTSSGTFGHSLSFGNADSIVVVAKNASIADAVATATCNLVKTKDDFNKAVGFAKDISGIFGVLIILDNELASWGEVEII